MRNLTSGWWIKSHHHHPFYLSLPRIYLLLSWAWKLLRPLRYRPPLLYSTLPLTHTLHSIRVELLLTLPKLHLEIPAWAQNPRQLTRLVVFTVTSQGTFVLTVQSMNVPTAVYMPQVTPNIVVPATTVLFATASVTPRASVRTASVPSATTWDTSLPTVPSQKTPVAGLSSTMETQRDCNLVPVVQVFEGGIVTVQGSDLIFSIVHLSSLSSDCPFTFTISIMFLPDVYQYTIW